MPWRLSTATRNAVGDALFDFLDSGGTGLLRIYTGTQPASADDAATGTLLAQLTFSSTSWQTFASGSASANVITSNEIGQSGTAGYARLVLAGGAGTHSDMDIGEGSGTLSFDDTNFISGGTAAISSMSITMPAE